MFLHQRLLNRRRLNNDGGRWPGRGEGNFLESIHHLEKCGISTSFPLRLSLPTALFLPSPFLLKAGILLPTFPLKVGLVVPGLLGHPSLFQKALFVHFGVHLVGVRQDTQNDV